MAATGTAALQNPLDHVSAGAGTDELLAALLRATSDVSDLIFSPGRKFQVQVNGEFVPVAIAGAAVLTADDTRRIASDLIGNNKAAVSLLREQGYCDVSYAIAHLARFRVNIFIQRGSCAVVMRVIPTTVPTFENLGMPSQLREVAGLRDGLVLITGPRGSGKTSTLAALIDCINERETCHIITIEDPIEFLHNHKQATVHQRELHSDTPSIALAMRAALRQVPNVIAVGELKDRETMELALEAAETGHLVLSTVNTLDAQQTVERFAGTFPAVEKAAVQERLGRMLRCVVSQRLIPRKNDAGRAAVFEVLTAEALENVLRMRTDKSGASSSSAQHPLDRDIEKLAREGTISTESALAHAINRRQLSKKLGLPPE